MCSNYRPVTRLDRLLTFFGVERAKDEPPPDLDVYPMGLASFIRLDPDHDTADGQVPLVVHNGLYGLLPQSAVELNWGRKTYNARCETVHRLLSFKEAWAKGWRCIIPAEHSAAGAEFHVRHDHRQRRPASAVQAAAQAR